MTNSASKSAHFYLTTPIYYVNARPHLGHAYSTIVCDAIARRKRALGIETWFLTGTDEHGQKIERSAKEAGRTPQEFATAISGEFRALWDRLGLTYDDFIRTTEPRHKRGVQKLFATLRDRGYVYKGSYTGQYCVSDEAWVDVPPGAPCPDCGRITETVSEENYFFKLSAFERKLLEFYDANPSFMQPESTRREVISFVRGGLSRSFRSAAPVFRNGASRFPATKSMWSMSGSMRWPTTSLLSVTVPTIRPTRKDSRNSGRPTCTSSAKRSAASIASTGRRF